MVNIGVATGEQANKLSRTFVQGGESLQGGIEKLHDGMGVDEFIGMYTKSVKATEDNLRNALAGSKETADDFLISADVLEGQGKIYADGQTDRTKTEVEAAKKRKDKLKEDQAKLQNQSNQLSKTFDDFIGFISNFVNKGFQALMYGFKMLAKGFLKLLDSPLFKWMGYKADDSLLYMFDSVDDLVAQLKDTQDKKAKIDAEIAKNPKFDKAAKFNIGNVMGDSWDDLTKKEKDIRTVMGRMLDTKDVDKAIAEREKAKEAAAKKAEIENRKEEQPAAPAAPAATSSGSAPAAIEIGSGTSVTTNQSAVPAQSRRLGGITRDPYEAIGAAPSGYNAKIPLPSGVSIPATVKMPADMTSTRKSLLTESDDINGILSNYMDALSTNMNNMTDTVVNPNKAKSVTNNILEMFSTKMDNLLDRMNENTDLQGEMLMYSKR
jgi:hypothetical protein